MSMTQQARTTAEAALKAERRQAVWASLPISLGLLVSVLMFFQVAPVPFGREIILSSILFAVIEIPRLERINNITRLFLSTLVAAEMLLFIPQLTADVTLVLTLAILALFAGSVVSLTVQRAESGTVMGSDVRRHAAYFGMLFGLGYLAIVVF